MPIEAGTIRGRHRFYDPATNETVLTTAPNHFYDDFLGKQIGGLWTARDTASAVEGLTQNGANGIMTVQLTSVNEVQLAGYDWNDVRSLSLAKKLSFESRFRLFTLPEAGAVACIGLCGNHNAAVDTVAESIWFRMDGNGQVTVEHDDTAHESSKVATGITLATSDWVVANIDCATPSSIKFYLNGNRVAAGTTFDMSQVPALNLQPVVRIGKESASMAVGTLMADYIRAWQDR